MSEPLLVGESLGKRYGRREVLRSASLWARPGRITALLGRNGSGKSTLLKLCAGWLRADHGTLRYRGKLIRRPRLDRLAVSGLLYLRQGVVLSPHLRIRTQMSAVQRRFPGADRAGLVSRLCLDGVAERFAGSLSGGEKKRVSLALALLRRPDCLLFDEPFAGIAPLDQELISAELRGLSARGCATVISGHDVGSMLALADDVVWVAAGSTAALGTPDEARAHPQFAREYLGAR